MNKDADDRLLPEGEYRDAQNMRVVNSEGSDVGAVENVKGNEKIYSNIVLSDHTCIGAVASESAKKIYWFTVDSVNESMVLEYDVDKDLTSIVLHDNRSEANNVLNFRSTNRITAANILIDSDNDKIFLAWTDDLNEPRFINVDRAKKYKTSGFADFTEGDISLIKKPPTNRPSLVLEDSGDDNENKIEERFLRFTYRYEYEDGFYSAFSPFSEIAFDPSTFVYDYSTSTNNGMLNAKDLVKIQVDSGGSNVISIDVAFKESNNNNFYLVKTINKSIEGVDDNDTINVLFDNNKQYSVLPTEEIFRLFDNVPRKAKAMELIGNRLIFGNYLTNFNLVDVNGENLLPDFSLDVVESAASETSPQKSLKSLREYEVAIVYRDQFMRSSVGLSSISNPILNIPNSKATTRNQLEVKIQNLAPSWATHYQFFIKESRTGYDTFTPTIFHPDGVFVWVKLEGSDVDKIKKGDFVYIKSDTNGVLSNAVQTEILEIIYQERNFLEDDSETETIQEEGNYFRIKPSGFNINFDKATTFRSTSKGFRSDNIKNAIQSNQDYIEEAIYTGVDGLNDLTSSGTYTGTDDKRYLVEITSEGTPDQFQWSDDNGATYTTGVNITGSAQPLNNGVSITFDATTGHNTDDSWVITAKSEDVVTSGNNDNKAWIPFKCKTKENEFIPAGTTITIDYNETRNDVVTTQYRKTLTATQGYANVEEWFDGDNVISQLEHPSLSEDVIFRRGRPTDKVPTESIVINPDKAVGDLYMLFKSSVGYFERDQINIDAEITIVSLENRIIFETKPTLNNTDVFFEHGEIYPIDTATGYHQSVVAGDTDQNADDPAVLTLDVWNCITFGNGYESNKIRDKFNADSTDLGARQILTSTNYGENRVSAGLIFGEVYEQTTNYNGINVFNPSSDNTKDLDDRYGSIQKLFSRDNNLFVFQEDKIHQILFNKSILFNADGTGSVSQSSNVLGQETPYAGEYGIGTHPESFSFYGNRIYFVDSRRGAVMRLGGDGLTEISRYGMRDYFRDAFNSAPQNQYIGGFDPYHDQYVLSSVDVAASSALVVGEGASVSKIGLTTPFTYTFRFEGDLEQQLNINGSFIEGAGDLDVTYDGNTQTFAYNSSGAQVASLSDIFDNAAVTDVTITVTPSTATTFHIDHSITNATTEDIKILVVNDAGAYINGTSVVSNRIQRNGSDYLQRVTFFSANGPLLYKISRFETIKIREVQNLQNGDTVTIQSVSNDQERTVFDSSRGHRLGYLVSSTDYGQSGIGSIIGTATYISTTQSVNGNIVTTEGDFTLSKSSGQTIYIIFDYRTRVTTANDFSLDCLRGGQVVFPVLQNSIYAEPVTVELVTGPSEGRFILQSDNTVKYTNYATSVGATDTMVVRVTTVYGSDTATLTADIVSAPTPGQGFSFLMSDGTEGNSTLASCRDGNANVTRYHDGEQASPQVDDYIYTDVNLTTKYNPSVQQWFKTEFDTAIYVLENGRVFQVYNCTGSPPTG